MPARKFDRSTLPALDSIKSQPLRSLNLDQLRAVAVALEIPDATIGGLLKTDLLAQVTRCFQAPGFSNADLERFVASRPATSVKLPRTSATKDTEDEEQDKTDVLATGAHKKMLEDNRKSDPPALTKRLSGSTGIAKNKTEKSKHAADSDDDADADAELSSLPPLTPRTNEEDEADDEETTNVDAIPDSEHSKVSIVVDMSRKAAFVFFLSPRSTYFNNAVKATVFIEVPDANISGSGTASIIEIHIPAQEMVGKLTVLHDGKGKFTTTWKPLIQMVLARMSPLKGRWNDYKIKLAGVGASVATIGEASQDKFPPFMDLPAANRCTLGTDADGLCASFTLKQPENEIPNGEPIPFSLASASLKADTLTVNGKQAPTTAAAEDAPSDLIIQLRESLNAPKTGFGASKKMSEFLSRFNAVKGAIEYAEAHFKNSTANGPPFILPNDNFKYGVCAGATFTRRDIEVACHVGHTVAKTDRDLLAHPLLVHSSIARRWIAGDAALDPAIQTELNIMTRKQFIAYLNDAKKSAEEKAMKKAKKRKLELSSSEMKDVMEAALAAKRAKLKEDSGMTSDNMDDTESDDA
ncbi:hypothetical protein MKEN_00846600 [Mycena kentingensis (nom. inval.)]|nr:hypothetical protein MKEN_00846600 [Mycena kentingensis (nom. inval.)]